jgi:hypothetical protein
MSSVPPPPPPSQQLRREDVALLKTALAVIVVRQRLRKRLELPPDGSKGTDDDVLHPAKKRTAAQHHHPFFSILTHPPSLQPMSAIPLILHDTNDNKNHSIVSNNSSGGWKAHLQHMVQLIWNRMSSSAPFDTSRNHAKNNHWYSLCVHVACQLEQLVGLSTTPPPRSTTTTTSDETPDTMEISVAHERAAPGRRNNVISTNSMVSNQDITNWLSTQLTTSILPPTTIVDHVQNHYHRGGTSDGDETLPNAVAAMTTIIIMMTQDHWYTIWSTMVSIKPTILSEYFVLTLLDLILQPFSASSSSKAVATTETASSEDNTTTHTTMCCRLHKVHYLTLLEYIVLDIAPDPVRQWTRRILQHQYHLNHSIHHDDDDDDDDVPYDDDDRPDSVQFPTTHENGGGAQDKDKECQNFEDTINSVNPLLESMPSVILPLLPAVNSSWYSTSDMAYDYYSHHYLHHHPQRQEPSSSSPYLATESSGCIGETFLLIHGLASISERLTEKVKIP